MGPIYDLKKKNEIESKLLKHERKGISETSTIKHFLKGNVKQAGMANETDLLHSIDKGLMRGTGPFILLQATTLYAVV